VLGRCTRILEKSSQDRAGTQTSYESKTARLFSILLGTLIAGFAGSILWLLLPGPELDRSQLWTAIGFGAFFGGWVGLASSVSFNFIRRLHQYATRSALRTILTFVLLGGIAGAPIFFPFGDGLLMALGLAAEGAILGAALGVLLGILFVLLIVRRTKTVKSDS